MMTIVEVAYVNTPAICEAMDLPWKPGGYAVLMCRQPDGSKVTRIGTDLEYLRLMESADGLGDIDVPHNKFPLARDGWPDDWRTAR